MVNRGMTIAQVQAARLTMDYEMDYTVLHPVGC